MGCFFLDYYTAYFGVLGCERSGRRSYLLYILEGGRELNDDINDWKEQWFSWKDIPSCKEQISFACHGKVVHHI